jgi:large subunit ribosomal protein L15
MPLIRRIPKRGFTHVRVQPIAIINVKELNRFDEGSVVSPELLLEKGLVDSKKLHIKILGDGALTRKLTVRAHRFSKSAQEKITAAGGQMEILPC